MIKDHTIPWRNVFSRMLEICRGKSSERHELEDLGILEYLQLSKQVFAVIIFYCMYKSFGQAGSNLILQKVYE